jgi:hypothetical protein
MKVTYFLFKHIYQFKITYFLIKPNVSNICFLKNIIAMVVMLSFIFLLKIYI